MAISVQCGSCGASHQVQDDMAGKQARCTCGNVLTVPAGGPMGAPMSAPMGAAPMGGQVAGGQITVACGTCGQQHSVAPSMAGQQARCSCGAVLTVPAAGASSAFGGAANALGGGGQDDIWGGSIGGGDEYQVAADPPNPFGDQPKSDADVLGAYNAPTTPTRSRSSSSGESVFDGSMMGGIAMIIISIVWFFGGLAVGFIFFYPPILFIIGVGVVIKSLFD